MLHHLFLSILLTFGVTTCALGQSEDPYTTNMQAALTQLDSLKADPAGWAQAAAKFEMLAAARPDEWLPCYYASYCLAMQSLLEEDAAKRDQLIARALECWKTLKVQNDETHVLRAWVAQASLAVDGMSRWRTEGNIISEYLGKAKKLNPGNPRALLIEADGVYWKPKMFGGGAEKAKPMYQQAVSAYEKFVPASPLHPVWGKEQAKRQLAACQ